MLRSLPLLEVFGRPAAAPNASAGGWWREVVPEALNERPVRPDNGLRLVQLQILCGPSKKGLSRLERSGCRGRFEAEMFVIMNTGEWRKNTTLDQRGCPKPQDPCRGRVDRRAPACEVVQDEMGVCLNAHRRRGLTPRDVRQPSRANLDEKQTNGTSEKKMSLFPDETKYET